ncbi:MAG: photosystem II biosynthesis protein, partial [Microcystaceae cyanobacterium]
MPSKSSRDRLPFEPRQNKKKIDKQPPTQGQTKSETSSTLAANTTNAQSDAIPEVVSKRMIRRMAIFCGIPSTLGMLSFVISYWIIRYEWFKLPRIAVVLVSLGLF